MSAAGTLSPRTPDQPMAFTRDEFVMGAVSSWLFFLGLLAVTEVVIAVVSDVMASTRGGSRRSGGASGPTSSRLTSSIRPTSVCRSRDSVACRASFGCATISATG